MLIVAGTYERIKIYIIIITGCVGPVVARSTEDREVPGSNHTPNVYFSGHEKNINVNIVIHIYL